MTETNDADPCEPHECSEELSKFEQLARALFRVDRKDVPKHEPKKRAPKDATQETPRRV